MRPLAPPWALRAIKLLHTIVWALFAGAIVALPVVAWQRNFRLFLILTGVVLIEVAVLAVNGMRCPLTPMAARYTDDRADNFDIYLPLLLARYNKQIFGTLFVAALVFGVVRWLTGTAAAIDTGRVEVAGSSLFYESAGRGSPVILLHGGNLDRRMWDAEFEYLREHHRVVRYDARGYGRSGPADTAFSAHDDLLALMRGLGIPRATLVGLSLGGRIAIDFALAYPEMVDRLVLAAPGISGGTWAPDGDTLWLQVARQAAARLDSVGLALAWLESAYIRTALQDSAMAVRIREIVVDNAHFWMGMVRHQDPEKEAVPPAAGRLSELKVPILLLVGSDDTPFIHDVARAIAAQAPQVQRIDLPGIGHMINLEAPLQFRAAVSTFLAK